MIYSPTVTCCFTGHRVIPRSELAAVEDALKKSIALLYLKGYRHFVAGGALGFDMLAAKTVLALKERVPDIALTLVLPCADQAARWHAADIAVYEEQKSKADEVICLADAYFDGCMQKRNAAMVAMSTACIAYLTRSRSGAGQTVRMANEKGLDVINVAPGAKM